MVDALLLIAFRGRRLPAWVRHWIRERQPAGVTLFRAANVSSAAQVRALTIALQGARPPGTPPLLIAADEEGGQLSAFGPLTTPFPGNLALGATGDPDLARAVGRAIGRELRALGVNVDYAPVCDLATNPANPSLLTRAFGADPNLAGRLAAAFVEGLQSAGVAATAKHFPGAGEAVADPHHGLPELDLEAERLAAVELVPFRAAVRAGVRLVMVGHLGLPRLTGDPRRPATLSSAVVGRLLRREVGFRGVVLSDALDMRALGQGPGLVVEAVAGLRAGLDLLLCGPDRRAIEGLGSGLRLALERGLLDEGSVRRSVDRIGRLRRWLAGVGRGEAGPEPHFPGLAGARRGGRRLAARVTSDPEASLGVLRSPEHEALARTVAERSVTLVRNDAGLLPLHLEADDRVLVVVPRPRDLTPADTSSTLQIELAAALRRHHPRVDEAVVDDPPTANDVAGLRDRVAAYRLVVVASAAASFVPEQAALVRGILAAGVPTVTVAVRTPYDLAVYPEAATHLCTYAIQAPALEALAAGLFGRIAFRGRLPVAIPGCYPIGHGLVG